ncbi:hypothetical protein [Pseudovibrio exalbescens]|uniref:hypothetical protein n=1 Tax=Pseudovibrio exalbescens TaxID=197461 RepID=UPI000C9D033E|nr:hypothetical protein [Pseudovibrio exalbescens]
MSKEVRLKPGGGGNPVIKGHQRKPQVTQTTITKAVKALVKGGIQVNSVEITPDGTVKVNTAETTIPTKRETVVRL